MKKSNDKSGSRRSVFRDEGKIELNDIDTSNKNNAESANSPTEQVEAGTKIKKKKNKFITVALDLAIVACLVVAAVLIITPIMRARRQDEIMRQLAALIESGPIDDSEEDAAIDLNPNDDDTDIENTPLGAGEMRKVEGGYLVDAHANAIAGEEYEDFGQDFETPAEPLGDTFLLEPMGMIQVPKEGVEINLPLLKGATHVPLRYGAGWYQSSAQIGEQGRATILGHTMAYGNDRFFTKLNKTEIGDEIRIVEENRILSYEVYDIKIIDQSELQDYLINNEVDSEIMLVTCDHYPVYGQRLLVFANLVDVELTGTNA